MKIDELTEFKKEERKQTKEIKLYTPNAVDNVEIKVKSIDDYLYQVERCVNYSFRIMDIFYPPPEIFQYLCTSNDKTYLFLSSVMRCLIYFLILQVFYENFDVTDKNKIYLYIISIILIIFCIINVAILLYVMIKPIKLSQYLLEPTIKFNTEYSNNFYNFYQE
jgi:hypothetical protein